MVSGNNFFKSSSSKATHLFQYFQRDGETSAAQTQPKHYIVNRKQWNAKSKKQYNTYVMEITRKGWAQVPSVNLPTQRRFPQKERADSVRLYIFTHVHDGVIWSADKIWGSYCG